SLAAHAIDIMQWFLGADPTTVASAGGRFALTDNGETPDTQDALYTFPGFTAVWSHREASGAVGFGASMEFFGTKGSLSISRSGYTVRPDRKVPPASRIPQAAGAGHPVGGPERVAPGGPAESWTTPAEDRTGGERDQFKRHVRDFLDCVKARKQPV